MTNSTQFNPERLRVALDHGEVVELDGGTLVLDGEETRTVVLRLAGWRARAVARVLEEWSAVSRIFNRPTRPQLDELELSRTLEVAAAALGETDEPLLRAPRGTRAVPSRQRLAAVAVLAEREPEMSAVQRLALVDAAAWWLSEPSGGQELAYALLGAACSEVTAEQAYLALITPSSENPAGDQSEGLPS
ncbi:MAG TPA: hypothetical protein VLJ59_18950 [Mycobacteriales bacterium]|nr:hypothetical protein [Mycobacteriales bacterium]